MSFPKAQSIFRFRLQGSFVPAKCDVPSYSRFPWCYICSYFESTAFPRFRFREFRKFLFCSWARFLKNSFRLATTVWIRRYPTASLYFKPKSVLFTAVSRRGGNFDGRGEETSKVIVGMYLFLCKFSYFILFFIGFVTNVRHIFSIRLICYYPSKYRLH